MPLSQPRTSAYMATAVSERAFVDAARLLGPLQNMPVMLLATTQRLKLCLKLCPHISAALP